MSSSTAFLISAGPYASSCKEPRQCQSHAYSPTTYLVRGNDNEMSLLVMRHPGAFLQSADS
jgi:hypothetical protein